MQRSFLKNKYFLTTLAIVALASYSFIVYAAAPRGGYTAGATLDPACAPGDPDCVVAISNSGSGPAGSDFDVQFGVHGAFAADSGVFAYNQGSKTFRVLSVTTTPGAPSAAYNGKGLNDLTVSGSFSSSGQVAIIATAGDVHLSSSDIGVFLQNGATITGQTSGATGTLVGEDAYNNAGTSNDVWLSNVSGTFQSGETVDDGNGDTIVLTAVDTTTADTFQFTDYNTGNHYDTVIDGSVQNFPGDFNAQFGSTTGHTLGDTWDISFSGNTSAASGNVLTNTLKLSNGTDILSLIAPDTGGGNYSLKFPSGQGGSGDVLTNDGAGNLSWVPASGWSLTGNSGTNSSIDFIGTTDAQDLIVKTKGAQIADFGQSGNVAIGSSFNGRSLIPGPVASGAISTAIGTGTVASGLGSTAIGFGSTAVGNESVAFGEGNIAESVLETTFGFQGTDYTPVGNSHASVDLRDRLFNIGNGFSSRSDAFTILKNGKTGIGYNNFETTTSGALLQVNGGISSSALTSCSSLQTDSAGLISCGSGGGGGGGSTNPAGSNLDVQFNENGSFGADSGKYTYDPSNLTMSVLGSSGSTAHLVATPGISSASGPDDLADPTGSYTSTGGIMIIGTAGDTHMDFRNLSGSFTRPGTVTGQSSGATADIEYSNNSDQIWVANVVGSFQSGETISDGNGDTADITTITVTTSDTFRYDEANGAFGFLTITGGPQALPNDLHIQFGSSTGHNVGQNWNIIFQTFPGPTIGTVLSNTFKLSNGTDALSLIAPDAGGGNYSLKFPSGQGNSGDVLVNDGAGNLSWQAPSGGGSLIGSTSGITSSLTPGRTTETWLGQDAGTGGASTNNTVFIGIGAGAGATSAEDSFFVGQQSGSNATNAAHSIFIGYQSGQNDHVDNLTTPGTSILIGDNTSTGRCGHSGCSNSIAIGNMATNTMTNQFLVAPSYNKWQIAGVDYVWPGSQASTSNQVLTNNGSGNLSWSSPAVAIGTTGHALYTIYTPILNAGQGGTLGPDEGFNIIFGTRAGLGATHAGFDVFLGATAGQNATYAVGSNFIGLAAGYGATNASYSEFIGHNTGNNAVAASNSIFLGQDAGNGAATAANSIFLGQGAGMNDSVNNTAYFDDFTTFAHTSIAIGHNASPNGNSDSIALGAYATNTAPNQFMIGSSNRPIYEMDIVDGTNTCLINTTSGLNCTSDERLKTNITDLPTNTLDTLGKVRTVTYNWKSGPNSNQQIGFLAQDLEQYYPELVSTAPNGYFAVNYANMTPVLVESIRELNLKLVDIQNFATASDTTFVTIIKTWFATATNGITDFFAGKVHTQQLCVGDSSAGETCITKSQLDQLITNSQHQSSSITIVSGGSGSGSTATPAVSPSDATVASTGDSSASDATQPAPTSDSTTATPTVTPPASDPSQPAGTDPVITPVVTTPDPSTVVAPTTDISSTPAVTTSSTDTSSTDTTVTQ